jgi:predicted transcriptional regulator YdeE
MKKTNIQLSEIKLIGITARTTNAAEANWAVGKIFPTVQRYFHGQLAEKILHRKAPGTTFCAYMEYESDWTGEYTYFIGEEVTSFEIVPEGFETHIIPAQNYIKFTNGPAPMPEVVAEPWKKIWQMSPTELGGIRSYHTDFEIYDERASDHQNVVLDICIGITDNF